MGINCFWVTNNTAAIETVHRHVDNWLHQTVRTSVLSNYSHRQLSEWVGKLQ